MRLFLTYILIVLSVCFSFSKPKKKNKVINSFKFDYPIEYDTFPSSYNIKSIEKSSLNEKECQFVANVKDNRGEDLIGVNFVFKSENKEIGNISDFDGNIDFLIPKENYILIISYIGFTTLFIDSLSLNHKNKIQMEIILGESHSLDIRGIRCKNRLTPQEILEIKKQMDNNIIPDKVKCNECQTYIAI